MITYPHAKILTDVHPDFFHLKITDGEENVIKHTWVSPSIYTRAAAEFQAAKLRTNPGVMEVTLVPAKVNYLAT